MLKTGIAPMGHLVSEVMGWSERVFVANTKSPSPAIDDDDVTAIADFELAAVRPILFLGAFDSIPDRFSELRDADRSSWLTMSSRSNEAASGGEAAATH